MTLFSSTLLRRPLRRPDNGTTPFGGVCTSLTETCNGFNDDCNGLTDEGLGFTTCGTIACEATVNSCNVAQGSASCAFPTGTLPDGGICTETGTPGTPSDCSSFIPQPCP